MVQTGNPESLPPRESSYLWTLVLDLDGTLVTSDFIIDGPSLRAHVLDFLATVRRIKTFVIVVDGSVQRFPGIEIILWSAGNKLHVVSCLDNLLDQNGCVFDHVIYSDHDEVTPKDVVRKNLSLLPGGRSTSSIIIDDSCFACINSGFRALLVPQSLCHHGLNDNTLLWLKNIIRHTTRTLAVVAHFHRGSTLNGIDDATMSVLRPSEKIVLKASHIIHHVVRHYRADDGPSTSLTSLDDLLEPNDGTIEEKVINDNSGDVGFSEKSIDNAAIIHAWIAIKRILKKRRDKNKAFGKSFGRPRKRQTSSVLLDGMCSSYR